MPLGQLGMPPGRLHPKILTPLFWSPVRRPVLQQPDFPELRNFFACSCNQRLTERAPPGFRLAATQCANLLFPWYPPFYGQTSLYSKYWYR
eukprot:COSAG04_NODE_1639_length_6086_cov_178.654585_3_plen_91_part_00